jgi:pantoate--beta-alanine ligase
MSIPIVRTVSDLRKTVAEWRRQGLTVAVVPTMGALHEGHLSLVRAALGRADRVIVTLFVNPKQFNSQADLAAYPKTEQEDAAKLAPLGAHLLYAPHAAEMYPEGFATNVSVSGVSEGLCGAFRPGHFDGVATVVTKLFLQSGADLAFFGEKDFQQLHVVRRLVRDLDIPIEIVACPTVREADGLAMSSRNVRLSPEQRLAAPKLASILFDAAERLSAGAPAEIVLAEAREALLAACYDQVEYLELRTDDDLSAYSGANRPARLLAAAWLGSTRLIDNVKVLPQSAAGAFSATTGAVQADDHPVFREGPRQAGSGANGQPA